MKWSTIEKIRIFSEEILRQGDDFAFDVISASEIIRLLNVAFVLRIITYWVISYKTWQSTHWWSISLVYESVLNEKNLILHVVYINKNRERTNTNKILIVTCLTKVY